MLAALLEIILDAGMRPVNTVIGGDVVPPAAEPEALMMDGELLALDNEILVL